MTFEADFKAYLQADPAIVAIVADRIHPVIVPEGSSLPVVTYQHVFGAPQVSLSGFTSGLTRYLVQVDCWALTFEAVAALALAVRDRIAADGASTFGMNITEYPLADDYEPDTKRYRRAISVACWFRE